MYVLPTLLIHSIWSKRMRKRWKQREKIKVTWYLTTKVFLLLCFINSILLLTFPLLILHQFIVVFFSSWICKASSLQLLFSIFLFSLHFFPKYVIMWVIWFYYEARDCWFVGQMMHFANSLDWLNLSSKKEKKRKQREK